MWYKSLLRDYNQRASWNMLPNLFEIYLVSLKCSLYTQVRNDNKQQYLDALAQWKLAARCRLELDAFLRGLTLLIPDNLLAIFDENELEVEYQDEIHFGL